MTPRIEVLVAPDCPHGEATLTRIRAALDRLELDVEPEVRTVSSVAEARELRMPGSPTVRVDGRDLEPSPPEPSLACRRYEGEGIPPAWRIEAGLLRALEPGHVLFLCVANSARSQIAEGLARASAPEGTRISSAGSEPASVRPQAIRVLEEVGIDASGQRSKGVDEVEVPVHAVVTLCAEEACPVWLGSAWRVHWPLPDPAAVEGTEEEVLDAFRAVREELRRRFRALFGEEGEAGA